MERRLVSVIMPVYNGEKYVRAALESVLAQGYSPLEILVVNDGSTDGTADILASFGERLDVIEQSNAGIGAARNAALAVAKGEYVALMDADDLWEPEKLAKQVAHLEAHPELGIVFCMARCFISPELPEEVKRVRYCPPGPIPGRMPAAALIRRGLFGRVGHFNTELRVGEFIDWLARAEEAGVESGMLDEVLYLRRIHDTNTGVVARKDRGDYTKLVHAALKRRRAAHR